MKITSCKTNHIINPLGFGMEQATVSWITEDTTSKKQVAAQVIVARDAELEEIIYDSGKSSELSSLAVKLPITLTPYTRYYWIVKVWGDTGDEAVSEVNWFETGKREDSWVAKWITPRWEDTTIHPYIRKSFFIKSAIKSARAYVTGMGLYELEINGKRVGTEYLTPYCNTYDAWVQCQTYDITELLKEGDNAVGAMLANGWAKGRFGTFGDFNTPYCRSFALLCELRIIMEDGSVQVIGTDADWKCKPSPIISDGIYDGEVYDANLEIPGWSNADFNDSDWDCVKEFDAKGLGKVEDRLSLPVIVKETVKPVKLIHTPAGEWVLDMGQNMVGWLRIRIHEPKGTTIRIQHGEVLQDNNFYRDNLRNAKAEFVYTSDGTERIIEPSFTFFGFRYAKLQGFTEPINIEDFTGCVVYSDLEETGKIETSDPYVNRLFLNALWGQKGNFLDIPTDCPQRDERMGWTGDTQVFSGTASFNMDTYAFYSKFMRDVYEEQKFCDGMVASVVPTFTKVKSPESSFAGGGSCAWGDVATVVPWELYLHFGDKAILERQYPSMKAWVDWIRKQDKKSGNRKLWTVGFHFGDWLALDGPVEGGVMGGTDNGLLASAYYCLSTNILSKAASVLGYDEDAIFYGKLTEEVKKAIQDEFFSKNGRSTINTQTAHVVALHFDLVQPEVRKRVLKDLQLLLKKSGMHLKTGFIGTPYLCRVLSENGDSESAYKIFFQEDYPSWLYEVIMGATTIWERWNSILPDGKISGTGMNSLNHYAYGSIVEWMYRHMCGINPLEEAPGFKKFVLKPEVYGKLYHAKATLKSSMGIIESGWFREKDGSLTVKVTVPFNAEAEVYLPDAKLNKINGINALTAKQEGDKVKVTLEAGTYTFNYMPAKNYVLEYSIESPLRELLANPKTKAVLAETVPHLLKVVSGDMGIELPYSIADAANGPDSFMLMMLLGGTTDLNDLNEKLKAVPVEVRTIS
ncbi:glycoside hydrolase family 78 protein [Clostridium sp. SYSU_GA19001]|uniref:alpha-L-rhamnosidase n=1 Tax=Clostridium caldaquaticum TaxID=2940653 RepID=UPI0020776900|nr:alpha-L-rhamnosidase [Clostridium caldaquaticum]MCM8712016.1 glycoside hydrolase family 78 protein [Clostridium caldaquaticum]